MNEGNLPNPVSPCTTIGAPVTRVIFIQQPNKQTQRTLPITGTAGGQQMPRWDHSPATYGPEESQWPGTRQYQTHMLSPTLAAQQLNQVQ